MESIKISGNGLIKAHIDAPFDIELEIYFENPGTTYAVTFELKAIPLFFYDDHNPIQR